MSETEIVYYPGCSLPFRASQLDSSARSILSRLGIEFRELPSWNCCGGLFSKSDFKSLIGSSRILVSALELGRRLLTVCPFCYNTLRRVNLEISRDPLVNKRVNAFLESNYHGELEVIHILDLLREYGYRRISELVINPLECKVACYYGCMVLRPKSIALDDAENPRCMQNLISAIGAQPVEFPYSNECCGSYLIIQDQNALRISSRILESAMDSGAQLIATICPLCSFNLERASTLLKKSIPIIYFTQLMESALTGRKIEWKS